MTVAQGLLARGWEIDVVLDPENTRLSDFEAAGATVHRVPMKRTPGPGDWGAIRELRRIDRECGFPIVHAHSTRAGMLVRLGLRNRHRIVYTPNCFAHVAGLPAGQRAVAWTIEQALGARTGVLAAAGEWEAGVARSILGLRRRVTVVLTGLPAPIGLEPDGAMTDFAAGRTVVGMVAAMRTQKAPLLLVEAAARLASGSRDRVAVAVVGDGELADAVEDEIVRLGVSDVARRFPFSGASETHLRALDLFVLPSRWEAYPLSIIEAMGCGLATVATDVGGTSELVEPGETGWLIPPDDVDALVTAIETAVGDEHARQRMGATARERWKRHHTVDAMIDAIEACYEALP